MKNQFHYIFIRPFLVHVKENEFFFLFFHLPISTSIGKNKIKENDFLMFGFTIEKNIKGNQ